MKNIFFWGTGLMVFFATGSCNSGNKNKQEKCNTIISSFREESVQEKMTFARKNIDTIQLLNVAKFGTDKNGTADDAPLINKALKALKKSNKTGLFFPEGIYHIRSEILLEGKNIRLVGSSPEKTLLKAESVKNIIINGSITEGLQIKNMGFDGAGAKKAIVHLNGNKIKGAITIKNCLFKNPNLHILYLENTENVEIANTLFRGEAEGTGAGIYLINGCSNINITQNKFLYLYNGVYVVGRISQGKGKKRSHKDVKPNTNIVFTNNYLDAGWFLFPGSYQGKGENVQYTQNILIDPERGFKTFPRDTYIKVYKPLASGIIKKIEENKLSASNANFNKENISAGNLIRIDGKIALVQEVVDSNTLKIENWLQQKDLSPAETPKADSNFKISKIVLGRIKNNNTTKIRVGRFYDLQGNTIVPKNGWEYTVMVERTNYPFFASANNSGFNISKNTFLRGWADQIAIYGNNAVIKNNLIKYGRDMGITLHGKNHTVVNNTVIDQGTGALFLSCVESKITKNQFQNVWLRSATSDKTRGTIISEKPDENQIKQNNFKLEEGQKNKVKVEKRTK